jgi:hypothetical protein
MELLRTVMVSWFVSDLPIIVVFSRLGGISEQVGGMASNVAAMKERMESNDDQIMPILRQLQEVQLGMQAALISQGAQLRQMQEMQQVFRGGAQNMFAPSLPPHLPLLLFRPPLQLPCAPAPMLAPGSFLLPPSMAIPHPPVRNLMPAPASIPTSLSERSNNICLCSVWYSCLLFVVATSDNWLPFSFHVYRPPMTLHRTGGGTYTGAPLKKKAHSAVPGPAPPPIPNRDLQTVFAMYMEWRFGQGGSLAIRTIMSDLGEAGDAWRKHPQHKSWVDRRRPMWWELEKKTTGLSEAAAKVVVDLMDKRRGTMSVSAFIITLDKPPPDWFRKLSHSAAP